MKKNIEIESSASLDWSKPNQPMSFWTEKNLALTPVQSSIIHIFEGEIKFVLNENELIKLCANGDIFVKGNLVKNDIEVVNGMMEFLTLAGK